MAAFKIPSLLAHRWVWCLQASSPFTDMAPVGRLAGLACCLVALVAAPGDPHLRQVSPVSRTESLVHLVQSTLCHPESRPLALCMPLHYLHQVVLQQHNYTAAVNPDL